MPFGGFNTPSFLSSFSLNVLSPGLSLGLTPVSGGFGEVVPGTGAGFVSAADRCAAGKQAAAAIRADTPQAVHRYTSASSFFSGLGSPC
jgi:hypothetical protein